MPGLYVLVIRLAESYEMTVGSLGPVAFPCGTYLYVGSARGPGGLRARVDRHRRQHGKRMHWHIDVLLQHARVEKVFWTTDEEKDECTLAARLDQHGERFPTGFGASDCRCGGHLIHWTDSRPVALGRVLSGMNRTS